MDSLKVDFEAQMAVMEERLVSQTVKETVPLVSPRAHRSSCASAPYEASPIDTLHGPAQCKLQIKFTTMIFSMDAVFGQVWPSPLGNQFITMLISCMYFVHGHNFETTLCISSRDDVTRSPVSNRVCQSANGECQLDLRQLPLA